MHTDCFFCEPQGGVGSKAQVLSLNHDNLKAYKTYLVEGARRQGQPTLAAERADQWLRRRPSCVDRDSSQRRFCRS